jgi:hypothetical protein
VDKVIRFGLARATGDRDARIITALPLNEAVAALQKYVTQLTLRTRNSNFVSENASGDNASGEP